MTLLPLLIVATIIWMAFYIAGMRRRLAPTGTHDRYICTTIQRALLYPALLQPFLATLIAALKADPFLFVFAAAFIWGWAREHRALKDADDDHWFKGGGKRLRRWLTSKVPTPSPHTAGA